jgi:hypothetical protein
MANENWLETIFGKNQLANVMKMNEYTSRFGITISEKDALVLSGDRKDSLKEARRVEFGEGILPKLIQTFCDSPYIYQDNFTETIGRLQDIFYEYKNESMDILSDDELLEYMKDKFDGECGGSLDNLEESVLDEYAREVREQSENFLKRRGDE